MCGVNDWNILRVRITGNGSLLQHGQKHLSSKVIRRLDPVCMYRSTRGLPEGS